MNDTLELVEGERSLRRFQGGHSKTGASTLRVAMSFLPEALHAAGARAVVGLLETGVALGDETVNAGGEKRENLNSWYRFSRDHQHDGRRTELHPKPGSPVARAIGHHGIMGLCLVPKLCDALNRHVEPDNFRPAKPKASFFGFKVKQHL